MDDAFAAAHNGEGVALAPREAAENLQCSLDDILDFCSSLQNMLPRQQHPLLKDSIKRTHHIMGNVHTSLVGLVPEIEERRLPPSVIDVIDQPYGRFVASYTSFSRNLQGAAGYKPRDLVKVQETFNTAYGHFRGLYACAGTAVPASLDEACQKSVVPLDDHDKIS